MIWWIHTVWEEGGCYCFTRDEGKRSPSLTECIQKQADGGKTEKTGSPHEMQLDQ